MQVPDPATVLTTRDHRRDAAGLTYVYPVVSRRAGGLSIGINLNPNNACNWACRYCQVPDLTRGAAPTIDLACLEGELRGFLHDVLEGDFLTQRVPEGMRRLCDVAFSGNGEPTASPQFAAVVERVITILQDTGLAGAVKVVVISNGSQLGRPAVQQALQRLATVRGELWFKLDRGLALARRRVNGVNLPGHLVLQRLACGGRLLPTWLQTCLFDELDGAAQDAADREAYLALVAAALQSGVPLAGVLLYTLARPPLQAGGDQLRACSAAALEAWAVPLRALGLAVRVSA